MIAWVAAVVIAILALAPSLMTVPSWWPVGAPIRLGLDLRGGTHLLYGVDLDGAVHQTLGPSGRELELALRDAQVGAATVDVEKDTIVIRLADRGRVNDVRSLVSSRFPDLVAEEGGS